MPGARASAIAIAVFYAIVIATVMLAPLIAALAGGYAIERITGMPRLAGAGLTFATMAILILGRIAADLRRLADAHQHRPAGGEGTRPGLPQ